MDCMQRFHWIGLAVGSDARLLAKSLFWSGHPFRNTSGPHTRVAPAKSAQLRTRSHCHQPVSNAPAMKLDVNVLRYLSKDDWRVLTSVEMGEKNVRGGRGGSASYASHSKIHPNRTLLLPACNRMLSPFFSWSSSSSSPPLHAQWRAQHEIVPLSPHLRTHSQGCTLTYSPHAHPQHELRRAAVPSALHPLPHRHNRIAW